MSETRLPHDALSSAEIESLLRACSWRAPSGIRNAALIAVLWRCGLRLGEALALRPQDVDLDAGTLTVQHAKGGKRRVVGVDAGTRALVARWVKVRSKRVRTRGASLFCTLDGRQIDQSYIRHLLPRLARRAGIEKRVHAHALRHAYAVALEGEGARLSTIRDLLGHGSAATTDRYLRRLGAGDAVAFARGREWQLPERNGHVSADGETPAAIRSQVGAEA
jgi:site-specific recombinase XerD